MLLSALGYSMWPHYFASAFTARSADVIRRNAVVLPLYALTLPFVLFAGFAAILVVPGLANGDLALLTMVRRSFPPWFLGLVGGAGALTAMVPAAVLILTAATLFAKNIFRPTFAPTMSDAGVARLARIMVVVIGLTSLGLALHSSTSLVSLLLIGYAGVAQLFPGVVLGLFWERVTTLGVFCGLVAGVAAAVFLLTTHRDPVFGVNAGFVALCVNFAVVVRHQPGEDRRPPLMPPIPHLKSSIEGIEDETAAKRSSRKPDPSRLCGAIFTRIRRRNSRNTARPTSSPRR